MSRCDWGTLSGGVLGGGREVRDGDEGWLPSAVAVDGVPWALGAGWRELSVACLPSAGWWRWLNLLMWPDGREWYLRRFLRCCCLVLCRDTKAPAGVHRAGFWRIGESLRSGIRAAVALHPQEVSCRDAYRLAECLPAVSIRRRSHHGCVGLSILDAGCSRVWLQASQRAGVRGWPWHR